VVNLDHYDVVLGVPFLEKGNVSIDFARRAVRVGSTVVPTVQGEGKEYQYPKRSKTVEAKRSRPVDEKGVKTFAEDETMRAQGGARAE
jgi:hypothetical protein